MTFFSEINENFDDLRHVSFFEKFSRSFKILIDGFKAFIKYPILLLPIVLHIILTALLAIGSFYYFLPYADNVNSMPTNEAIYALVIISLFLCATYAICSFLLLEFIQQIETCEKISICKAFKETFFKNMIKGLPIIIVWTIISILGKLFRGKRRGNTLIGNCITMSIFCIFPAIAWEDKNSFDAVKKGLKVLKATFVEIFFSIIQKEFIVFILFLPFLLLAYIIFTLKINMEGILLFILIFCCFAIFISALCEYIGQLFTASIYIWYKKWESETYIASKNNTPKPSLYDIPMPSLLDDIPDLIGIKTPRYL